MRNFRRRLGALLAALLTAWCLPGCAQTSEPQELGAPVHLAAAPATAFPVPEEESPSAATVAAGANDFALRFSRALLAETPADTNFLCSPYSAWLPLAALANAADEERLPELLAVLGEAGISLDQLNAAARDMLSDLTAAEQNEYRKRDGLEEHNPLSIANAIFVDQEARLQSGFAQTFAQDYGGAAMTVDFSSPDAAAAINDWARKHTEGLIPEIVAPGTLDLDAAAAIANALYFSDRWSREFNADDTAPGSFHAPGGDVTAQFMLREGEQPYFEDESLQALQLNFALGGSLLVLLPRDGDARSLLSSMDTARLSEITDGTANRDGRLLLPRFELASGSMQLNDVLSALDVPLLDSTDPALNGLVEGESVYLSQAVQQARIKVDEKGTTAAAVTVMAVTGTALVPPTAPFDMICDRPFAFLLLGDSAGGTDQVLFAGVCCDPAANDA